MHIMNEDQISHAYAILYLVTFFPIVWIVFAQEAKRCHDRGNSGWYQLIPYYVLWMIFGDGDEFDNDDGSDPKGTIYTIKEGYEHLYHS